MKVIDLLNKIANGEEVLYRIKYNGRIYEYADEIKWYLRDDMKCELTNSTLCLNEPVEIIEEKKIPEKLLGEPRHIYNENELYIVDKVNEIIDFIDELLKNKGE